MKEVVYYVDYKDVGLKVREKWDLEGWETILIVLGEDNFNEDFVKRWGLRMVLNC